MRRSHFGEAWVLLCLALALHVLDETLTNFLVVYNPTAMAIRGVAPWLPVPVFQFETWIAGLILLSIGLMALSPFAFRGSRWLRPFAYVLAIIMIGNAFGHTVGTLAGRTFANITFERPMPGFYSSPFLFAAGVYMLIQLRRSAPQPLAHSTAE